jgi:hypothetical protein
MIRYLEQTEANDANKVKKSGKKIVLLAYPKCLRDRIAHVIRFDVKTFAKVAATKRFYYQQVYFAHLANVSMLSSVEFCLSRYCMPDTMRRHAVHNAPFVDG